MIIELVIKAISAVLQAVLGMFPDADAPGWMEDATTAMASVWQAGAGLGAWIPWSVLGTVTTAVLTCLTVAFGIRVVRIVLSLFTGGGGSAA